nr:hypothetical protein CTI12_AA439960 [Tanacetum cinerariifolium]
MMMTNDVTNLNQTSDDHFLNLLCCDNVSSDDVDNELSSDENWSPNEESDDSDGNEQSIEPGVVYLCYDPIINWKKMKPMVEMKFESVKQLKESLIDYGVSNGYPLEYPVNEYQRLLVRCGKEETDDEDVEKTTGNNKKKRARKCPFRLWASMITEEGSFQIKTLNEKHICSRKFSLGSLVAYNWIAKRYFKEVIQNPDMSIREMQMDILRKFKCKVSTGQCSRAKKKALQEYEGGLKEHYSRLCDYRAELLRTNLGSTVKMSINTMSDGSIYFNSYYVCFKGIKDGWINGCRKVIGLDGCFLKSVCEGQLLSAMGRDANNHIFPLAWAVVSVENKENWKWFLELLRNDIGMVDGVGLTLISDQHK